MNGLGPKLSWPMGGSVNYLSWLQGSRWTFFELCLISGSLTWSMREKGTACSLDETAGKTRQDYKNF